MRHSHTLVLCTTTPSSLVEIRISSSEHNKPYLSKQLFLFYKTFKSKYWMCVISVEFILYCILTTQDAAASYLSVPCQSQWMVTTTCHFYHFFTRQTCTNNCWKQALSWSTISKFRIPIVTPGIHFSCFCEGYYMWATTIRKTWKMDSVRIAECECNSAHTSCKPKFKIKFLKI
jgi:hypothetical protein